MFLTAAVLGSCIVAEPPGASVTDYDGDGFVAADDCDDRDSAVHPDADERCNAHDDNCDGEIDESTALDAMATYPDTDGDGWGAGTGRQACSPAAHWVAIAGDCDDADPAQFPGAAETCNAEDDDCDDAIDEEATDAESVYLDADGDTFGDADKPAIACAGYGYASNSADCDDERPDAHPGLTEVCGDGADNDCDGTTGTCHRAGVETRDAANTVQLLPGPDDLSTAGMLWLGDTDGNGTTEFVVSSNQNEDFRARTYIVDSSLTETTVVSDGAAASWVTDAEGALGPPPAMAAVGDVDGDGAPDFGVIDVYASSVRILPGGARGAHFMTHELGEWIAPLYQIGTGFVGGADVTGDGSPDMAIGSEAAWEASDADPGNVWVLPDSFSGEHHFDEAYRWNGEADGDAFGSSSALADLDADGIADLAVSAPGARRVYIFNGPISADGVASDADNALSVEGAWQVSLVSVPDGDKNGYEELLIADRWSQLAVSNGGAVWSVDGGDIAISSGGVSDAATAVVAGTTVDELCCVPASGDFDGDGQPDTILGAPFHETGDHGIGSIYIFYDHLTGSRALSDADYTAEAGAGVDGWLGDAIAVGGSDVRGGVDALLVTAPRESFGVIYLIEGTGW